MGKARAYMMYTGPVHYSNSRREFLFCRDYCAHVLSISLSTLDRRLKVHPEIHRERISVMKVDGSGATHILYISLKDYATVMGVKLEEVVRGQEQKVAEKG